MSLTGKAINYLQQQYPNANFLKDIILQDDSDGRGPYVKYWGLGTPQPTDEELNAAAESMVEKPPKPTVDEQLLMIYKDMKHGTKTFVETMDNFNV